MTVPWQSTLQKLPPIGARVLMWSANKREKLPCFGYRTQTGEWYSSDGQFWPTHWAFCYPPEVVPLEAA